MTRNFRRRLVLYGSAALVAGVVWLAPSLIRKASPPVRVRRLDTRTALSHEGTKLLQAYIRIDSSNPPGYTREATDFLARFLACEGIPYQIVGDDPQRPILVARLAGVNRHETLMLLAHTDVVPAGDLSYWKVPPFAGEMGVGTNSDYLYGRGVLDMKGQTIAYLLAMASLKRDGITPLRDILFVAEPGEESFTPEIGIGWLVENRPDLLAGVTDVLNEGGVNESITSDIARFGIEVLQKATINVTVKGGEREPLQQFREFLRERDKGLPFRLLPEVEEFMKLIGPSRNDIWGRYLVDPKTALEAAWFRREAPPIYHSMVRDAIYPGEVRESAQGGFEMPLGITLLPGSSPPEELERLSGWVRERGLTLRKNFVTPESVPARTEGRAWNALKEVLSLDHEGALVGPYVLTVSYTSSSYLRAKGYRAFGFSPFNVNITDASRIHGANERIVLTYFVEGIGRMTNVLREYATAP